MQRPSSNVSQKGQSDNTCNSIRIPIIYLSSNVVNTPHQTFYLYGMPALVQQLLMEVQHVLAHSKKHTVLKRTTLKEEAPTTTGHIKWLNKLALCGVRAMLNS